MTWELPRGTKHTKLNLFLSWICHRFSIPNAGFDATNVLISQLFALWQFFFSQIWSPTQKNFTLFKVFTRASWQSLLWFVQSWCRVTNSGYYLKRNQTKLENTVTILTFFNKNKVSIKKIWQNNFHGVFEFWLLNDFWLGTLKMKDQQNWTVLYYRRAHNSSPHKWYCHFWDWHNWYLTLLIK